MALAAVASYLALVAAGCGIGKQVAATTQTTTRPDLTPYQWGGARNLVADGNFEAPPSILARQDGWVPLNSHAVRSRQARTGKAALEMVATGYVSYGVYYPTLLGLPPKGARYAVMGWVKAGTGTLGAMATISLGTAGGRGRPLTVAERRIRLSAGWKPFRATGVVADGGRALLQLYAETNSSIRPGDSWYLDAVLVQRLQ